MTKHEYYTYTKEELLNKGAKLPGIVMEDNAAVFQSMAEEMAEEIKKNKAILLIDYSNSYTYEELQKNKFRYENKMEIFELVDGK